MRYRISLEKDSRAYLQGSILIKLTEKYSFYIYFHHSFYHEAVLDFCQKTFLEGREMSPQLKILVNLPDDTDSISRSHTVAHNHLSSDPGDLTPIVASEVTRHSHAA